MRDRRLGDFLCDDVIAVLAPLELGIQAAIDLCEKDFTIDDAVLGIAIIVFFEQVTSEKLIQSDKRDFLAAFKSLIQWSPNVDQVRIWAIACFPGLEYVI